MESFLTWNTSRDLASFPKAWSHPAPAGSFRAAACAGPQSPLITWGAPPGDMEPSGAHGFPPGETKPSQDVASFLRKWRPSWEGFSFPIFPAAQRLRPQAFFSEAASGLCCAVLGGSYRTGAGILSAHRWGLVCLQRSICWFHAAFFCCQGCEGGEGERDLEEVSGVRGAPQERAAGATLCGCGPMVSGCSSWEQGAERDSVRKRDVLRSFKSARRTSLMVPTPNREAS